MPHIEVPSRQTGEHWAFKFSPAAKTLDTIPFTIIVFADSGRYTAIVENFEVAAQADTVGDAIDDAVEAAILYLNTIEGLGVADDILDGIGVSPHKIDLQDLVDKFVDGEAVSLSKVTATKVLEPA